MTQPPGSPALEPQSLEPHGLDWRGDIANREFEKALGKLRALAVVGRAETDSENALRRVVDALEAIRAKNYAGALGISLEGWSELGLEVTGVKPGLEALQTADTNWRNAQTTMRDALELARMCWLTRSEAENNLGVLEALLTNPSNARAHFQAALAADPRHYRALTNLGNLELEAGNLEQAEALYKQVIAIQPEYSVVYNNLAAVMRKRGKRFESVEYLKKSQRLYIRELRGQTKGTAIGQARGNQLTQFFSSPIARWGVALIAIYLIWRFVLNR